MLVLEAISNHPLDDTCMMIDEAYHGREATVQELEEACAMQSNFLFRFNSSQYRPSCRLCR